jgi:hypothetical protein
MPRKEVSWMSYKDRVGLDSGGRIRPYGSGRGCNYRSGKNDTTRAIGSRESDASVFSRAMRLRSAYARMRSAKTISMLIVCATAILIVSAIVLASVGKENAPLPKTSRDAKDNQPVPAPGQPFLVRGIVRDSVGAIVVGADVTITNMRLGVPIAVGTWVSEFDGYYEYDMGYETSGGVLPGDVMNVVAVKGTLTGSVDATVPDPAGPYINVDVTVLEGAIPEFPTVIVPIAGMLALFAVVRLSRRVEGQ